MPAENRKDVVIAGEICHVLGGFQSHFSYAKTQWFFGNLIAHEKVRENGLERFKHIKRLIWVIILWN